MPSQTRRLSSRKRSAATRIQKTFRKKHAIKRANIFKSIRQNSECAICHESLTRNVRILDCGHRFHKKCIEESLRAGYNKCPLCRKVISNGRYSHPVSTPNIGYNQTPLNRDRANAINNRIVASRVYDITRSRVQDYNQVNAHRLEEDVIHSPRFIRLVINNVNARQALERAEQTVINHTTS